MHPECAQIVQKTGVSNGGNAQNDRSPPQNGQLINNHHFRPQDGHFSSSHSLSTSYNTPHIQFTVLPYRKLTHTLTLHALRTSSTSNSARRRLFRLCRPERPTFARKVRTVRLIPSSWVHSTSYYQVGASEKTLLSNDSFKRAIRTEHPKERDWPP